MSDHGPHTVTLLLQVHGTNPLDAVEQFSLAIINNGISGYAFRVVQPDGSTVYVVDSDIYTPAEFEAEYMAEIEDDIEDEDLDDEVPVLTYKPLEDESVEEPQPLIVDHPLPEVVDDDAVVSTTHLT